MAQLTFTIADGRLTVGSANRTYDYASTDYRAKAWRNGDREGIKVYPINENPNMPTWENKEYIDVALNIEGVPYSPASVADFVLAFNSACGGNIGFNTQYPQIIISAVIDPDTSVATQLTAIAKAGYLTITAPSDNTGEVFIGDDSVDSSCDSLEASEQRFMELDDLSKIYCYASTPGDRIKILGAYKY